MNNVFYNLHCITFFRRLQQQAAAVNKRLTGRTELPLSEDRSDERKGNSGALEAVVLRLRNCIHPGGCRQIADGYFCSIEYPESLT